MKRIAKMMFGVALAASAPALAAPATADKLWRLDCGNLRANDMNAFSDTMAYTGRVFEGVASCYLIKHGTTYMLWDTGLPATLKGAPLSTTEPIAATLKTTVIEQLATIGVKPEQVTIIGISHYHFDHTGQMSAFPQAKLLIGRADLAALKANPAPFGIVPGLAKPWTEGTSVSDPVDGDRDVFGDGSVTMIDLPGHTPGHHGLLVRLAKTGPVLLSGDVAHLHENLDTDGMPGFNTNRADSLAAMDRYRKMGAALKARMIIQHDARDVGKLPAFPAAAD